MSLCDLIFPSKLSRSHDVRGLEKKSLKVKGSSRALIVRNPRKNLSTAFLEYRGFVPDVSSMAFLECR